MIKTPVVMIGYSRHWTLRKALKRLAECRSIGDRDIFLFLDAPSRDEDKQKCREMYDVAVSLKSNLLPKLQIIQRDRNFGVPGNLVAAVTDIVNEYGQVIFFEDDVIVSRTFLEYMYSALDLYRNDARIFCVNGFQAPMLKVPRAYKLDVYLSPRNSAWGFGIWADRWNEVDFEMRDWVNFSSNSENLRKLSRAGDDVYGMIKNQLSGRIRTWDVQCTYHMVKRGLYAVEPRKSLTKNIGFGTEGVHCTKDVPIYSRQLFYDFLPKLPQKIDPDESLIASFKYMLVPGNFFARVKRKVANFWLRRCSYNFDPVNYVK